MGSLLCQFIHLRDRRDRAKADELAGFVEAFTGSVINRGAKHLVIQLGFDEDQNSMPTANNQRNIGLKRGKVANPWRIQMRLVMVDAQEWFTQTKSNGLRGLETDEQCGRQTGALHVAAMASISLMDTLASSNAARATGGEGFLDAHARLEFQAPRRRIRRATRFGKMTTGEDFAVAHHGSAGFVSERFRRLKESFVLPRNHLAAILAGRVICT